MKDEILAEINEIIKEFEIAKKTKTGVYAEKDFAPDSIPSVSYTHLRAHET